MNVMKEKKKKAKLRTLMGLKRKHVLQIFWGFAKSVGVVNAFQHTQWQYKMTKL